MLHSEVTKTYNNRDQLINFWETTAIATYLDSYHIISPLLSNSDLKSH